jgi:hypothetical protein
MFWRARANQRLSGLRRANGNTGSRFEIAPDEPDSNELLSNDYKLTVMTIHPVYLQRVHQFHLRNCSVAGNFRALLSTRDVPVLIFESPGLTHSFPHVMSRLIGDLQRTLGT